MPQVTGGCLCGGVRYTVTSEPTWSFLCHCRDCQRYTGSPFEAGIMFPITSVSLQGELKTYIIPGGSGRSVHRRFCPHCGSGVVNTVDFRPDVMIVLAGTLDDPARFSPEVEVFCDFAQPWVHSGVERPRFPKMPI